MAFLRYYLVTNLLLLEYNCDQYNIIKTLTGQENLCEVYMYQGIDGQQYCIDTTSYGNGINNLLHLKFSDESDTTYYYPGRFFNNLTKALSYNDDDSPWGDDIMFNNTVYGTIIEDLEGNLLRTTLLYHDTIRIYISTGYVFNTIAGISLKVKANVNNVYLNDYIEDNAGNITNRRKTRKVHGQIVMLDWFMPKEYLKDSNFHWLDTPLYLNSKFYDRYIEIQFPSPYDCAINNRNIDYVYQMVNDAGEDLFLRGPINESSPIYIEFATVLPLFLSLIHKDSTSYESTLTLDAVRTLAINLNSNASYFNIRIYEDENTNSVLYYPVYGEGNNILDFDIDIMYAIDTGNIPMYDTSDINDANDGIDDFIETYGDNVCKWVIINEMSVTYNYRYIFIPDTENNIPQPYTEYFTNTIDYTGKDSAHGEFWRNRFMPIPKLRSNMEPTTISIKYVCHLYNRMNAIDIIRTASVTLDNASLYLANSKKINLSNIVQYKVVNKINKLTLNPGLNVDTVKEKYIRSYYDITDLIIKDAESGLMYTNGAMTLKLKHTNSNYMMRLYKLNDDNVRIPYDLTGVDNYKLVFPSISGEKIKIYPNMDSTSNNMGIGSLIFYISEEKVKQIMNVPVSERYFALMTDLPDSSQETTLYEGKVDYFG